MFYRYTVQMPAHRPCKATILANNKREALKKLKLLYLSSEASVILHGQAKDGNDLN